MGRFRTELHRTLVHPISKLVGSAVDGFSGRGRKRRYQALEAALEGAYADCNHLQAERDRLQSEMQDLIQYTDAELAHLKHANEQLCRERDALQLQVWTLEEQLEIFLGHDATADLSQNDSYAHEAPPGGSSALAGAANPYLESIHESNQPTWVNLNPVPGSTTTPPAVAISPSMPSGDLASTASSSSDDIAAVDYPRIDLSNLRLALVGGHPATRRGVIQELQLNYGLRHWVEVPRMNEANTNRSKVKSKISQCTLVVLITGYMSHRLTEIIFSLKEAGSLAGDVLQLNCKGKSGVVREILNHVEHVGG